jgi:hypothetical protein
MSIPSIPNIRSTSPTPIYWSREEEPESRPEEDRAADVSFFDPSLNMAAGIRILPFVEETEEANVIMMGWELGMDFRFTPFDSARNLTFDYQLFFNYMSDVSGLTSAPQALGLRHALGITARTSGLSLGLYVTYEDAFTILRQEAHYSLIGASTSFELETGNYRPYFECTWLENLEGGWSPRIYQMVLGVKSFVF